MNLELQGFNDSFLTYSKYLHAGLWEFRLSLDRHLPTMAVHESAMFSFIFFWFLHDYWRPDGSLRILPFMVMHQ